MKQASYDHSFSQPEGFRSHLVGIPYRLKDPPDASYHKEKTDTISFL